MAQHPKHVYTITAVFLCLVCAGGYVFQLATDSVCFTKLAFTYVGNSAFWLITYYFFIRQQAIIQTIDNGWLLRQLAMSIGIILANQVVVFGFVEASFQLLFNCSSEYGIWGEIQVNNLILHGSLYFLLLGLDRYFKPTESNSPRSEQSNLIHIRQNGKINRLPVNSIVYLEASNNAVIIHTEERRYWIFQSLKSLLVEIDHAGFKRIHRTYAVNEHFIRSFTPKASGDGTLHLQNHISLKVSRNYKKALQLSDLNLRLP